MAESQSAFKPSHVGIIGAGVSGLRCASVLLEQGFGVTILEARDRIGGRICQSDKLGYTVDIGPNWIHANDSEDPNPVFKIAQQTKTPLHSWNDKQLIYDSSGNVLSGDLADRLSTILWEIIEEAFQFSAQSAARNDDSIPNHASLYDFIKQEAEKKLENEEEKSLLLKMSEMFGAYVGEPVWKQSLKFSWMEECCGGDEVFVQSSYSEILKEIARPALTGAKILLNTYVEAIVTPETREANTQTSLRLQNGQTLDFDEIVVTIPLGWLKRNQAAFSPPLPLHLTSAVDSISLSQLEKVFITFPSAFWNHTQTSDTFPSYTNWLRPSYATDTNPEGWPQEIWDLSSFEAPNKHPTILFYTYGDCSRYIVESIHNLSADAEFRFLDHFFQPYYSRLPGYDKTSQACKPKAILATKWLKDDLNGNASYCNFQVGVEEADKNVLAFREGCPERRLWFCGEHAAPFEECGTVAGAYLSGEAAGKKILEIYDTPKVQGAANE
ncbi:hypothetical protein S40288_04314 [Stachybotrys chartarum IBT 40288]|nr:hypothetical protein S40288_04314 [Stachybotrys chartarum IBT 40288]